MAEKEKKQLTSAELREAAARLLAPKEKKKRGWKYILGRGLEGGVAGAQEALRLPQGETAIAGILGGLTGIQASRKAQAGRERASGAARIKELATGIAMDEAGIKAAGEEREAKFAPGTLMSKLAGKGELFDVPTEGAVPVEGTNLYFKAFPKGEHPALTVQKRQENVAMEARLRSNRQLIAGGKVTAAQREILERENKEITDQLIQLGRPAVPTEIAGEEPGLGMSLLRAGLGLDTGVRQQFAPAAERESDISRLEDIKLQSGMLLDTLRKIPKRHLNSAMKYPRRSKERAEVFRLLKDKYGK